MSGRATAGAGLAVGVGLRPGADPAELVALLDRALAGLELTDVGRPATRSDVAALATVTARVDDDAVLRLGEVLGLVPIACHPRELTSVAAELAQRAGGITRCGEPAARDVVGLAVGTPAVAEPAAVLAARGLGGTPYLVLGKQTGRGVTLAVAAITP